ncbi:gamma-glutamyl kinase [Thiohalorhabdus denitrificans]|uniref:Glutamate 5-kinase n=1 Tax=Thiohalorhabdus denitrificans TaxID=381306 RepID=A0A0P9C6B0_9GAMM|nr:glutamate 5-kinase [Thiohalorhabdus denitrificans]KPV40638.1 gamma-glutamyl kinase [Thiohalorhabdus denitrificans]SCY48702.1 glutamate 5-kinase [Thiohalorhabdus denitrificans]
MSRNRSERQRNARRWVVKVGSSLLTRPGGGLALEAITEWVRQLAELAGREVEPILVSSGAVAAGMGRLGWADRPTAIHDLQAAAAVGQSGLVEAYEERFTAHGLLSAQVLLTHDDLSDRRRYLNARNTLRTLLELGVVPIVNENDTVVTEEIRFGDNDTLAALVANLVEADLLVILTDSEGVFQADPRVDPHAALIREGEAGDPAILQVAGGAGSAVGTGGMRTKILAAQRAARSGTGTAIASGYEEDGILRLRQGEPLGTYLHPGRDALTARKQWLANQLQVHGRLHVDAGAARVIREEGRSLLPVGITAVEGEFRRGEVVSCVDPEGREVCRGLVNYPAHEVRRIQGLPTGRIAEELGYLDTEELIHRDDLAIL